LSRFLRDPDISAHRPSIYICVHPQDLFNVKVEASGNISFPQNNCNRFN